MPALIIKHSHMVLRCERVDACQTSGVNLGERCVKTQAAAAGASKHKPPTVGQSAGRPRAMLLFALHDGSGGQVRCGFEVDCVQQTAAIEERPLLFVDGRERCKRPRAATATGDKRQFDGPGPMRAVAAAAVAVVPRRRRWRLQRPLRPL